MMKELLLSVLGGYKGDFSREQISFFHPSEKEIYSSLSSLGIQYSKIKEKVRAGRKMNNSLKLYFKRDEQNIVQPSLYMKGVCAGMEEVLDSYLLKLSSIEQMCKDNEHLPLSYIRLKLKDYIVIFPHLVLFGEELFSQKDLRGGLLMDYIIAKINKSVVVVKDVFKRILYHCNKILVKNLISWIVYGVLLERQYSEFFIRRSENGSFVVDVQTIPKFISLGLAERILFIGEAVRILQKPVTEETSFQSVEKKITGELQEEFSHLLNEHVEKMINENIVGFEYKVKTIYSQISKQLWDFIVVESNLEGFLLSMKKNFLLGQGDFYLEFIKACDTLMLNEPKNNIESDVNSIFQTCGRDLLMETKNWRVRVVECGRDSILSGVFSTGLNLELQVKVKYPLNLFFGKAVLDKYNQIFRLLFVVKKVQLLLKRNWSVLSSSRTDYNTNLLTLSALNSRMLFVVNNLSFYFTVDVVERLFEGFMGNLEKSKDFKTVQGLHVEFLNNVLDSFLWNVRDVRVSLDSIFKICSEFYFTLKTVRNLTGNNFRPRMMHFHNQFNLKTKFLFKILSVHLVTHSCLNPLLQRVDKRLID